jgi:hypothetical protein
MTFPFMLSLPVLRKVEGSKHQMRFGQQRVESLSIIEHSPNISKQLQLFLRWLCFFRFRKERDLSINAIVTRDDQYFPLPVPNDPFQNLR